MITKLVENAKNRVKSKVDFSVKFLDDSLGANDRISSTRDAITRMDNSELRQFALELLSTILATRSTDTVKQLAAAEELTTLFGKEVLECEVVTRSTDGFFFTLTSDGCEFRAWNRLFQSVSRDHFDSCGTGCVYTAYSTNPEFLRDWLAPIVGDTVEWKSSTFGSIWIGSADKE